MKYADSDSAILACGEYLRRRRRPQPLRRFAADHHRLVQMGSGTFWHARSGVLPGRSPEVPDPIHLNRRTWGVDLDRALIAYYEQEVALDRRAELP
ncbi:MAG: hypothetical protein R2697_06935 [Ilumatobacteraceae bacterium]